MKRNLNIIVPCLLCLFVAAPTLADPSLDLPFEWTNDADTIELTAVAEVKLDSGLATNSAFGVDLMSGQLKGSIYESVSPIASDVFRTFCVEKSVFFKPGTTYWASIDPVAYSGNESGVIGDGISDVAEYMYDQYLAGNYTTDTELQQVRDAIWWAEGEGGSKAAAAPALTALYTDADYSGLLGSAEHTYALNLWTLEWDCDKWVATDVQSQLITVPVPGAVLLGMLGLGAAGMKLRRFA